MNSGTRLFVGNLPGNVSETNLTKAFTAFGKIVNLDVKCKPTEEDNNKSFAFITLQADFQDIENCIRHFTLESFGGNQLYVTRARESFLERLNREREEAKQKDEKLRNGIPSLSSKKKIILKFDETLNPRKRMKDRIENNLQSKPGQSHSFTVLKKNGCNMQDPNDKRKQDADKKRMESMRKKVQEFKQKQNIIKIGLDDVDKSQNRKRIFTDNDGDEPPKHFKENEKEKKPSGHRNVIFHSDDSDDEVNFEIKKQFEGKSGQKILDLQSRYKSDKRFTLDERFIEEEGTAEGKEQSLDDDNIEVGQADERDKQKNILQDVLGVAIRNRNREPENKKRTKMGMQRFDPSQPEHAKFLAPVEERQNATKKTKKKNVKVLQEELKQTATEAPKVEVSKEQFYKVSETLKEAIAQPATFSFRSLFGNHEEDTKKEESMKQSHIPLEKPKDSQMHKVKNPLEPGEKNPFVYDSSESEFEEDAVKEEISTERIENKAIWREKLFFSKMDHRLQEGLAFFNKPNEVCKQRRELKSLMKKRIYNKERKNQMFKKKIGGRKKTMKKIYRQKS